ncbi:hypothetical protein SAMN06298216_2990 [Spirosomataceae bacterium TFI 002]|nr:hypothetical protein SAMN06298216_2990 [Spirosomataceae bacterium TFI 002]
MKVAIILSVLLLLSCKSTSQEAHTNTSGRSEEPINENQELGKRI